MRRWILPSWNVSNGTFSLLPRQLAGKVPTHKPVVGIMHAVTLVLEMKQGPGVLIHRELLAAGDEIAVVTDDVRNAKLVQHRFRPSVFAAILVSADKRLHGHAPAVRFHDADAGPLLLVVRHQAARPRAIVRAFGGDELPVHEELKMGLGKVPGGGNVMILVRPASRAGPRTVRSLPPASAIVNSRWLLPSTSRLCKRDCRRCP